MENKQTKTAFVNPALLWVIVNNKQTKRIAEVARKVNSPVGTYLYCEGSVRGNLLTFLGLDNVRREMAIIINDQEHIQALFEALDEEFNFGKPHNGVEFIIPLSSVMGTILSDENVVLGDYEKEEDGMYEAIMTIVDRGIAKTVMDVAKGVGATGGTIMHGRGTARDSVKKVFNMEIEPEKEIVIIIAKKEDVKEISSVIDQELGFDQPNTGILFTFPLLDVKGID